MEQNELRYYRSLIVVGHSLPTLWFTRRVQLLRLAISLTVVLSLSVNSNASNATLSKMEAPINASCWSSNSDAESDEHENDTDSRRKLYLVLMAPFPADDPQNNPSWVAGHIAAPAVQMALRQINSCNDTLADHKLVLIVKDTACNSNYKVRKAIVDIMRSEKQIVGIVGPGCSEAAIALAEQVLRPGYDLVAITPVSYTHLTLPTIYSV